MDHVQYCTGIPLSAHIWEDDIHVQTVFRYAPFCDFQGTNWIVLHAGLSVRGTVENAGPWKFWVWRLVAVGIQTHTLFHPLNLKQIL